MIASYRKQGGLHFVRIGRLGASFYVAKAKPRATPQGRPVVRQIMRAALSLTIATTDLSALILMASEAHAETMLQKHEKAVRAWEREWNASRPKGKLNCLDHLDDCRAALRRHGLNIVMESKDQGNIVWADRNLQRRMRTDCLNEGKPNCVDPALLAP